MTLELIVFDWDGTLMDSQMRILQSMQSALQDAGLPAQAPEQIKNIIGLGLIEAVRQLLPDADPKMQQTICHNYRQRYLRQGGTPTPLFNGAREVLEELNRSDYLLAVATGKGRAGLDQALQSSGVGGLFHATRCADESLSKPHPQMLQELMDELGVMPEQTLMIGDTEYDMLMAGNARAHALGVGYGVHQRERLLAANALACLDEVTQIPGWIADWNR